MHIHESNAGDIALVSVLRGVWNVDADPPHAVCTLSDIICDAKRPRIVFKKRRTLVETSVCKADTAVCLRLAHIPLQNSSTVSAFRLMRQIETVD